MMNDSCISQKPPTQYPSWRNFFILLCMIFNTTSSTENHIYLGHMHDYWYISQCLYFRVSRITYILYRIQNKNIPGLWFGEAWHRQRAFLGCWNLHLQSSQPQRRGDVNYQHQSAGWVNFLPYEWQGSKTWQKIQSSVMCAHELQDSSVCVPCVSSEWRPPEHLFASHCTRQDPTLRSSTRRPSAGNCTHFRESNLHSAPQQPWGSWEGKSGVWGKSGAGEGPNDEDR